MTPLYYNALPPPHTPFQRSITTTAAVQLLMLHKEERMYTHKMLNTTTTNNGTKEENSGAAVEIFGTEADIQKGIFLSLIHTHTQRKSQQLCL